MEDARTGDQARTSTTERIEIVRRTDGSREVSTPVEDLDAAFDLIAMLGWRLEASRAAGD